MYENELIKLIQEGTIGKDECRHEGRTDDIGSRTLICKNCGDFVVSIHTDLGVYYFSMADNNKINYLLSE